jgi:hypothetical protein
MLTNPFTTLKLWRHRCSAVSRPLCRRRPRTNRPRGEGDYRRAGRLHRTADQPEDLSLPGDSFTAQPPAQNPKGKPDAEIVFTNHTNTRNVTDTIAVFADVAAATAALVAETANYGPSVQVSARTTPSCASSSACQSRSGLLAGDELGDLVEGRAPRFHEVVHVATW